MPVFPGGSFLLNQAKPFDDKAQVATFADLANIPFKYAGLRTYVVADDKWYRLAPDLTTWSEDSPDLSGYIPRLGTTTGNNVMGDIKFADDVKLVSATQSGSFISLNKFASEFDPDDQRVWIQGTEREIFLYATDAAESQSSLLQLSKTSTKLGSSGDVSIASIGGNVILSTSSGSKFIGTSNKLFRFNHLGVASSGGGVGIEINENAAITGYFKTSTARTGWQMKSPATAGIATFISAAGSFSYTLPEATGTLALTNGFKTVNGNSLIGSGDITISGGSGTPAGSTGQIQFNNAGAFGASSGLSWDNTNGVFSTSAVSLSPSIGVTNTSGLRIIPTIGSGNVTIFEATTSALLPAGSTYGAFRIQSVDTYGQVLTLQSPVSGYSGRLLTSYKANGANGAAMLAGVQFANDTPSFFGIFNASINPVFTITGTGLTGIGMASTTPGAQLQVRSVNATTITAILQAAASQTADIFQAQNSSGALLSGIRSTGDLKFTSGLGIVDANNVYLLKTASTVSSAVNYITLSNSATGAFPSLSAEGTDANIGFAINPKGTGYTSFNGTQSILISRGTTAQEPGQASQATPVNGMLRYDTTLNKFRAYENGAWVNVIGGSSGDFVSKGGSVDETVTGVKTFSSFMRAAAIRPTGTSSTEINLTSNQIRHSIYADATPSSAHGHTFSVLNSHASTITGTRNIVVVESSASFFSNTNHIDNVRLFNAELVLTNSYNTGGNYFGYYLSQVSGSGSLTGNAYGLYMEDINKGVNKYSIYTNAGKVRFGDLSGTGDRAVFVNSTGVLSAARVHRTLGTYVTELSHTSSTETDYFDFSIPANTLTANGDAVEYEFGFRTATSSSSYNMKGLIKIGSLELANITTTKTASVIHVLKVKITRTSASTIAWAVTNSDTNNVDEILTRLNSVHTLSGFDFTTAINFVSSVSTTDPTNAIICKYARINFEPAP